MREELEQAGRTWAARPNGQRRLEALRGLCDTWVPSVRPPRTAGHLGGFWERRASDLDIHLAAAGWIATRIPDDDATAVDELLDLLALTGFSHLPVPIRQAALTALAKASGEAATGLEDLRQLTLLLFYALPDASGRNPSWPVLGYPGPPETPPPAPPAVETLTPPVDAALELEADVCIVGSGAGGGVIAGELAGAGLDVVVIEAGGDAHEATFSRFELEGLQRLYWRGGYTPTADRNVTLLAGAGLGGGTTVNWTNCVLPPEGVRAEWAREHGLAGLDGPEFRAHLEAVLLRIGATQAASDRNGPNEALRRGAEAHGWSWRPTLRNTDVRSYDPATAGHLGYGDRSGSKRSTPRTYLADAASGGARVLTGCRAEQVLTAGGRATGVAAVQTRPDGSEVAVTVRAATVVVAGGALETPALLLRSGIGGPAVGHHLRLHPVAALVGMYDEDQRAWWGAPQTVIVDEFADQAEGFGFLLECPQYGTGLSAVSLPWRSGRDHKLLMGRLERGVSLIAVVRDRGAGRVTVDEVGRSVVTYPLSDALDRVHLLKAVEAMARLHAAAGARAVIDLEPGRSLWTRGTDLDGWIDRSARRPLGAGGRTVFSAHQMGTARMGTDARSSCADPEGQLHDTAGVWIGDTSAFPTSVGSNPMVTCMALARRTAHAIIAAQAR